MRQTFIIKGHPFIPGSAIGRVPPRDKKAWPYPRPGRLIRIERLADRMVLHFEVSK